MSVSTLHSYSQEYANAILAITLSKSTQKHSKKFFHVVEHAGYGAMLSRLMTGLNRSLELGANYSFEIDSPYSIESVFNTPFNKSANEFSGDEELIKWDFFKDTWGACPIIRANHQFPKCPFVIDGPLLSRHQWCSVLAKAICGTPDLKLQAIIRSTKERLKWGNFDIIIGLHVRRGDKNTEAPYIPAEVYIQHLLEIFNKHPNKKCAVFLASDDPCCIQEFQSKLSNISILWDEEEDRFNNYNAGMAKTNSNLAEQESLTAAKNISLLGQCDYVIGMSTAQFTWIGGLLSIFNHGLDTTRQVMIDPRSLKQGHWASAYGFNQEGEWPLRILHISPDENGGGAAKAAYRAHLALKESGANSQMLVLRKTTNDQSVFSANSSSLGKLRNFLHKKFNKFLTWNEKSFTTANQTLHSFGKTSRGLVDTINRSDADIINLHWVVGMLSINDIAKIKKPIVWTLHDMWPFCGGEHYAETDSQTARFKLGYKSDNRPIFEDGPDLNLQAWRLKKSLWKKPLQIITPSHWMADCVKASALMNTWPTKVIPNALNTDLWKPLDPELARRHMRLPLNKKLICFGAMGGAQTELKGFDLLCKALESLRGQVDSLELVIFGQARPENTPDLGFPLHYTGHLSDEAELQSIYSAADAFIIPSRMDNLPNTGVESMACGTPVIAFDTCGLKDIVIHQENGWLAKAFDVNDLAYGIKWVLEDKVRHQLLCIKAREFAVKQFSNSNIAEQYKKLYKEILNNLASEKNNLRASQDKLSIGDLKTFL